MSNINVNETGQALQINFGENISAATSYNFILEPKYGAKAEKSTATLGTINVEVGDEIYLANEYIEYTLAANDIEKEGLWRIKGEATMSSTNKIITDYRFINVLP